MIRVECGGRQEDREALADAVEVGRALAAQRPPQPVQRRRRGMMNLPPKYRIKARMRAHNRRVMLKAAQEKTRTHANS